MKSALEVSRLNKEYPGFQLKDISFSLPEGCVMGLIGPNGAGKTTLLNMILGLSSSSEGEVYIWGKKGDALAKAERSGIGMVCDDNSMPEHLKPKEINRIFKNIYFNWNIDKYFSLLKRLQVPESLRIAEMSKGNKAKLNLAVALSHEPRLLIMDEITNALDPVMRNDILKIFMEFVEDETKSILFSSHITSDLEKIADYIALMDAGKLIFCKEKEELVSNYRILRCKKKQFDKIDKKDIIAFRKEENAMALIIKAHASNVFDQEGMLIELPSVEDVMTIFVKGERL